VGPFPFDRRNDSASTEILRNDNRNDIWRPCHAWPCAGLAPASRDNWPRLTNLRDNPKTSRGRRATGKSPMVGVRMHEEMQDLIKNWAAKQNDHPSLTSAIRRPVELGLKNKTGS
jgi:hypothetical protein